MQPKCEEKLSENNFSNGWSTNSWPLFWWPTGRRNDGLTNAGSYPHPLVALNLDVSACLLPGNFYSSVCDISGWRTAVKIKGDESPLVKWQHKVRVWLAGKIIKLSRNHDNNGYLYDRIRWGKKGYFTQTNRREVGFSHHTLNWRFVEEILLLVKG